MRLSRRGFLAVAGAALSSTAWASDIQTKPTVEVKDDELGGQKLSVSVGCYRWELLTRSFGPRANKAPTLTLTTDPGPIYTIRLEYATIAGTNLRLDLEVRIRNPGNGWEIDIAVNGKQSDLAEPPLLLDWLTGQTSFDFESSPAIPPRFVIGGKEIFATNPKGTSILQLLCIGANHDQQQCLDHLRVLHPVIHGPLQLRIGFPGKGSEDPGGIDFSSATVHLLHSFDNRDLEHSFLSDLSERIPPFVAGSGFDSQKPYALFVLNEVKTPVRPFSLARVTDMASKRDQFSHTLHWTPDPKTGLFGMLSFGGPKSADAVVRFEAPAIVELIGPGASPRGSRLHFDYSQVMGLASRFQEQVHFTAAFAPPPKQIQPDQNKEAESPKNEANNVSIDKRPLGAFFELDSMAFLIDGRRDEPPDSNGESIVRIECGANMHGIRIPIRLLRAHLPAAGASLAMVDYPGTIDYPGIDATILIGEGTAEPNYQESDFNELPSDMEKTCGPFGRPMLPIIRLGNRCKFYASLENAQMSVKRSADLFDLVFEFKSYWIKSGSGVTSLDRRIPAKFQAICNCPTLVAVFPPQHVEEEVFEKPPQELAHTLISGNTRIAMQGMGDCHDPHRQVFDLTIENLTDWNDLALAVHRRALPPDSDTQTQIEAVGLRKDVSRTDAQVLWREAMLELGVKEHAKDFKFITQIEAVSGLITSPDALGRFNTPRIAPVASSRVPLWAARLDSRRASNPSEAANACVRVIHARDAKLNFMAQGGCKDNDFVPFYSTLTARDRSELLVLTSGFALPSLRRLKVDQNGPPNPTSSTTADPKQQFIDDPKGMVFRPADADDYAFVSKDTDDYQVTKPDGTGTVTVSVPQEGILVPRPFQEYDLTLSSLKANLRSLWQGEPPAPYVSDKVGFVQFYQEALNVEGYTHRASYGRDAFVQVSYKGFLFPLGHRVALIKLCERQVLPARGNSDLIDPTAYLIKRNMICCKRPVKPYPALGQPYSGRQFPAASVEMLTVITPDIMDPDEHPDELIHLPTSVDPHTPPCSDGSPPAPTVGRVFWPRTAPGEKVGENQYGNEIKFEYRIDGSATPVTSALIFVDNTAAHDPKTMESLLNYYNNPDGKQDAKEAAVCQELRTAYHSNAVRKYAPSLKSGETSFETHRWLLGASAKFAAQSTPSSNSDFIMD
ncbi:MAG TPA: hypothetical protein VMJ32_06530, partial [Pirellulales bacterium]|nr:hypothetical protein [Pirellulales bacterium]